MLSNNLVNEFHSQGFTIVREVFSREYVTNLANVAEKCTSGSLLPDLRQMDKFQDISRELTLKYDETGHPYSASRLCHLYSIFKQHSLSPKIVNCVEQLLGGSVSVYGDTFQNKSPIEGHSLQVHQDHAYYKPFTDSPIVACWLALDDATIQSGCVEYLPNSHLSLLPHKQGTFLPLVLEESLFESSAFVKAEVNAGDCVFHHSFAVHRSGPNTSPRPRRALMTVYVLQSAQKNLSVCGAYPPFFD